MGQIRNRIFGRDPDQNILKGENSELNIYSARTVSRFIVTFQFPLKKAVMYTLSHLLWTPGGVEKSPLLKI
jgi:hypothetical protein